MRALRREHSGPLRFAGVGGPSMQAEGLHSLFPMEELSVMGFAEVLPRLLLLRSRLHQSLAAVRELRPSVVLGIDSKAFCLGNAILGEWMVRGFHHGIDVALRLRHVPLRFGVMV